MANSNARKPEINVTPLIDVLLVLLIIFMVVAPAKPGSFEARTPAKPSADIRAIADASILVVTVAPDRMVTLNGTVMSLDELESTLTVVLADRVDRGVILRAPTASRYEDVVGVVDRIKGAGAGPIGLQVDFLEG